jgi:hypothetical protein
MPRPRASLVLFGLLIIAIAALTSLGPPEASLGEDARLVYLHGAWVWTALISFGAAALAGLAGLVSRKRKLQEWSIALGQAGIFFWITYLPLSLWTMQATWNGLFLEEPRWRIGVNFAVGGLLLQGAILVLENSAWGSALNALYAAALAAALANAGRVMHPPSPIAASGSSLIRNFFFALLAVCLLACWLLARWLLGHWASGRREPPG